MRYVFFLSMLALACSTGVVFSAGYAIQERSIKGLGRAFSAEAAMADDASVLASNPAGIVDLPKNSYSIGISGIDGHYSVTGSSTLGGGALSEPNVSQLAGIPSIYYTNKWSDSWSYGIGTFTNFGLGSEYSPSFAGVAVTETSDLLSLNINPSVAYRANEHWSFGAGLSLVYVESKLTGRLDATAGRLLLDGDDFGVSYNLGALYDNQKGTRVGLSYRSSVAVRLDGQAQNTLNPGSPVPLTDATADAKFPGIVELSVVHDLNSFWAVHADLQYTRWNSFQRLTSFTDGGAQVLDNTEQWQNSYKLAVGVTHKYSQKLTLRAGLAYDQTPVTSSSLRTLRIPDSDRIWVSCGLTYAVTDDYEVDFGYTYVRSVTASINEPASGNGVFSGEITGHSHVFGVAFSGKF